MARDITDELTEAIADGTKVKAQDIEALLKILGRPAKIVIDKTGAIVAKIADNIMLRKDIIDAIENEIALPPHKDKFVVGSEELKAFKIQARSAGFKYMKIPNSKFSTEPSMQDVYTVVYNKKDKEAVEKALTKITSQAYKKRKEEKDKSFKEEMKDFEKEAKEKAQEQDADRARNKRQEQSR